MCALVARSCKWILKNLQVDVSFDFEFLKTFGESIVHWINEILNKKKRKTKSNNNPTIQSLRTFYVNHVTFWTLQFYNISVHFYVKLSYTRDLEVLPECYGTSSLAIYSYILYTFWSEYSLLSCPKVK